MMEFVFWQNIISIHQVPFLRELARENRVTLCVERQIDEERIREGWKVDGGDNLSIIVAPCRKKMDSLIEGGDARHVFSGIATYPMVYAAFRRATALGKDITVLSEPYNPNGWKGQLRRVKYTLLLARFGGKISKMLVTGNLGYQCYRRCGMPADKLHQWGYFTEQPAIAAPDYKACTSPVVAFVGKLDERKNILPVLRASLEWKDAFSRFIIVGDGPLREQVKTLIAGRPEYEYLGTQPNEEISHILAQSDVLILPSLFDGWGAVVNEALLAGTPAFVSDMCGASILVTDSIRGGVAPVGRFAKALKGYLKGKNAIVDAAHRDEIRQWAQRYISPATAARYFRELFDNNKITAPWI